VWLVVKITLSQKKAKVSFEICRYRIRGVLSALIFLRRAALAWTFVGICTIFVGTV